MRARCFERAHGHLAVKNFPNAADSVWGSEGIEVNIWDGLCAQNSFDIEAIIFHLQLQSHISGGERVVSPARTQRARQSA